MSARRTIVGEVESLKGLVDEFSQFAGCRRRERCRRICRSSSPTRLRSTTASSPTCGSSSGLRPALPLVRLDAEQVRRVVINLVDNAVEAMERRGEIIVETQRDAVNNVVRVIVADDGPGIPAEEREKLFLPYYSTKRRGSGLGLAIVRRIIAEHGGNIDVADNTPRGTRFTIELPWAESHDGWRGLANPRPSPEGSEPRAQSL